MAKVMKLGLRGSQMTGQVKSNEIKTDIKHLVCATESCESFMLQASCKKHIQQKSSYPPYLPIIPTTASKLMHEGSQCSSACSPFSLLSPFEFLSYSSLFMLCFLYLTPYRVLSTVMLQSNLSNLLGPCTRYHSPTSEAQTSSGTHKHSDVSDQPPMVRSPSKLSALLVWNMAREIGVPDFWFDAPSIANGRLRLD